MIDIFYLKCYTNAQKNERRNLIMIYPKLLEPGYKIGVTATSSGFTEEPDLVRLESGITHFNKLGYPVLVTDNVRKCQKGRSSDGSTRADELMQLVLNPEVRAVIAASGGDYLVEMLPYLDLEAIKSNPTWVQGFSDTTGLVFTITTNLDIATIYANNFSSFGMGNWHSSLYDNLRILEGQDITQQSFDYYQDGYQPRVTGLEEFVPEKEVRWINLYPTGYDRDKELIINGRALGGCLDVCLNLVGTRYDKVKEYANQYQQDKILWYFESYGLNSDALLRGLWQLREAGWFKHASGFVFGRPCMYETYNDTTYEEAVLSVLGNLNLPIILETDIGHKPPQFAIMNGAVTCIRSFGGKGSITFERR
jgi:muramoyltetrapeptide carboxypeptidase LdcA involved in peptidoglycan recycling